MDNSLHHFGRAPCGNSSAFWRRAGAVFLGIGSLACASAHAQGATGAPSAPAAADVQQLGPVTVQGKRNPLEVSDRKLEEIKDNLPGIGDVAPQKKGDILEDFVSFYRAHDDPNEFKGLRQEMLLKMTVGDLSGAGARDPR